MFGRHVSFGSTPFPFFALKRNYMPKNKLK
jgi:hypothetical protein